MDEKLERGKPEGRRVGNERKSWKGRRLAKKNMNRRRIGKEEDLERRT